jgi:hypothetical protein
MPRGKAGHPVNRARREGRMTAGVPGSRAGGHRRQPRARPHITHGRSRENSARPSHRFMRHRCEQPLRVVRPAHRLGDCAGRSPGLRVITSRPAFPVSQWLMRTKGSPLTVAGAATVAARRLSGATSRAQQNAEPARVPSCLPGATRGTSTLEAFARLSKRVKIWERDRGSRARNSAGCCSTVTEYRSRAWHSGPACGPLGGHRTPAAVTQAGYAYCQLRDTQPSVQTRHGHEPRATEPVSFTGAVAWGAAQTRHPSATWCYCSLRDPSTSGRIPLD